MCASIFLMILKMLARTEFLQGVEVIEPLPSAFSVNVVKCEFSDLCEEGLLRLRGRIEVF